MNKTLKTLVLIAVLLWALSHFSFKFETYTTPEHLNPLSSENEIIEPIELYNKDLFTV